MTQIITKLSISPKIPFTSTDKAAVAKALDISPADLKINTPEEDNHSFLAIYKERVHHVCQGALWYLDKLFEEFNHKTPYNKAVIKKLVEQTESEACADLAALEDHAGVEQYQKILYSRVCTMAQACALWFGVTPDEMQQRLAKGEEYFLLHRKRSDIATLSQMTIDGEIHYLLQAEQQLPALSKKLIDDYWNIIIQSEEDRPDWFKNMVGWERRLLLDILATAESKEAIPKLIPVISSKLRTIPGLPNFRQHRMVLFNTDFEVIFTDKRPASSMVSTRKVTDKLVRQYHTEQNLLHIVDATIDESLTRWLKAHPDAQGSEDEITVNLPFLVQTLISPIRKIDTIIKKLKDHQLNEDKLAAIEKLKRQFPQGFVRKIRFQDRDYTFKVKLNWLSTNHPLNYANKVFFTTATDKHCVAFKQYVSQALEAEPNQEVSALLEEYESLLAQDSSVRALLGERTRELFLSSLEQLMAVRLNGIAYGSCVSGKDRKACELMHTDACEIYFKKYHRWPSYNDVGRQREQFVEIFVQIYLTQHHDKSAALNAPGASAIKTPQVYLAVDIVTAIGKKLRQPYWYDTSDAVASNNELHSIIASGRGLITGFIKDYWHPFVQKAKTMLQTCAMMVKQSRQQAKLPKLADEKGVRQCLQYVMDIIRAKKFWHNNTTYKFSASTFFRYEKPDGITELVNYYSASGATESAAQQLNDLYDIIRSRGQGSKLKRYPLTYQFYQLIKDLYTNADKRDQIDLVKRQLFNFYKSKVLPVQFCKASPPSLEMPADEAVASTDERRSLTASVT